MRATSRGGARNTQVGMDQGGLAGVLMGPQELVRRSLLSYQRSEEQAADRAAVNYLTATGQSAKGMVTTFERFANDFCVLISGLMHEPHLRRSIP